MNLKTELSLKRIKKLPILFFILLIAIFSIGCEKEKAPTTSRQVIEENWQFKSQPDSVWRGATVPGCVHTDLIDNEIIEDPYYRMNEKKIQWIGETDWEYKTGFTLSDQVAAKENINLIFNGLDTYADVYLNDSLILSATNMFRTWKIPVKNLLKENNSLRVYFHNVFKVNLPKYENAPYELQTWPNADQADVRIAMYSRKAGFHYGWDWGPRLITSGIWHPVCLEGWDNFKIKNVHYIQEEVSSEQARIKVELAIESNIQGPAQVEVKNEDIKLASKSCQLSKGVNQVELELKIDNPKLWWTNGLGEQPLYKMVVVISDDQGNCDTRSENIGIRSIEIVREKDQFGKSFYVKLNGVPIFIKGANYIPQDNFQNRVSKQDYEFMIQSAVDANMNMLRVWGGGIYENDIFYDLCDQNGILVWQDMMFACAMYPVNREFLDNVRNEVADNVIRARNHPCIALYCGNNENEISWYDWGWKTRHGYDEATQKQYEKDLHTLFYEVIPDAITQVDPHTYYHPTSPVTGYNGIGKNMGDSHFWGVWHGKAPFKDYKDNVARFMSEYGFQSYPEYSSIKKFTLPEDRYLTSDVMHAHQRSMADNRKDLDYGNRLINEYLERNFKTPKDFEHYLYVAQLNQAKGVSIAIEAHRQSMADLYCMGTLYWQINDCWPVASWSSIDYYGKWKALHYHVKKLYEPVILTAEEKNDSLRIYVVSDQLDSIPGAALKLKLMDFSGQVLWENETTITVPANTSKQIFSEDMNSVLSDADQKSVFFSAELIANEQSRARKLHYFSTEKDLKLATPVITQKIEKTEKGYKIELESDQLARYVMLSIENEDALFSDNYFDILPHSKVTVTLPCENEIADIENKLKVISLTDSY